jgi:hypothetical protein
MRAPLVLAAALAACADNATPWPDEAPPPPLACLPDRDGTITAAELPVVIGAAATYWLTAEAPVALAGAAGWDLATESAADRLVEVGPAPLAGRWYAADFPAGQFVLDAAGDLEAVYHLDERALWLHGLASREPAPPAARTLLVYDAPVPVLRLPLALGDAWTATGAVSAGTLHGLAYVGTDTYDVAVTGAGPLALPYVRFSPALKVHTHVVVRPAAGGVTTSRRQTSFLFECFGEIARAESRPDEPAEDFTTAALLRRFAL